MIATSGPRCAALPCASARATHQRSACTRTHRSSYGSVVQAKPWRSAAAKAIAEPQPVEKVTGDVVEKCIRSLQFLAVDATNSAASGHPGAPMALAPAAYILFNEYMRFNPKNPGLFNRDRFVLSNGHASMLQYGILHLCGSDTFTVDQLKQLRQWGSVTPGHPERQVADGIEVTTGPLGQGIANAVGLALAEAHLAARFNKGDAPAMVDNYTYAFLGDGCMMEGISQEACSLAGHWGLGKLICFYDDNKISIDGRTEITFTEDTLKRFDGLGWQVIEIQDGNTDLDGMRRAIEQAQAETDKPSLICLRTTIGYGSPNMANTPGVHGAALGADEAQATRDKLNWSFGEWEIPDEVYVAMRDNKVEQGKQLQSQREKDLAAYREKYPAEADELDLIEKGGLPSGWEGALRDIKFEPGKGDATRKHSHQILNKIAETVPTFLGGSADLASSNKTYMDGQGDFSKQDRTGRNVAYGVREHGMGAISNGIAAFAPGIVPFASTFTIFTDYMRAAMRLSALSNNRVLYVTTHDCIGLGGDGPTHQSVEQLAGFRAMPNMPVIRPCGGSETVGAYQVALARAEGPTLLALSRQGMAELEGCSAEGVHKGAYVIQDSQGAPSHILIGTGSEVPLCIDAAKTLKDEGHNPRVVSMPCMELFEEQGKEYKESVLPKACKKRVTVEALSPFGWREYATEDGVSIGMTTFGASADGDVMFEKFGFTAENIAAKARAL